MDHLWITPGARDPLIDHPRPALPRCYRLPLLPHRCCHTETPFAAAWARCHYAGNDVTHSHCCCPATAPLCSRSPESVREIGSLFSMGSLRRLGPPCPL